MVKILRLLRGYVVFMVTGSYPEKFVNICTYNGVNVWGVESKDGVVYCRTIAANYRVIRILSRRTSAKIRVKRKIGLPFILNKNRKRIGLPIGLVCFFVIFKVLSLFVWNFDIYGNVTISDTRAKNVLESIGVYEGVYGKFDSLKNLQTRAMIEFKNVSWITINIDGSKGEVKISELVEKGEITDETTPCNIKAEVDGRIIRVDAYSGASSVNSGDAVVKGNLLISGVVENEHGEVSLAHADGVVWAETNRVESFSVPKEQMSVTYDESCDKRYSCRLFNVVIPLRAKNFAADGSFLFFSDENKMEFRGETASVSLIEESIFHYDRRKINNTEQSAEKQFHAEMMLNELFNYGDKKIINRSIESTVDKNGFNYNVHYECEEDIGIQSDIIVEDNFIINNDSFNQSEQDSE